MLYGVVISCVLLAPLRRIFALTFALPSQVRNSSIHLIVLIFGVGLLPLVLQCGVLCVKGCCCLLGECLNVNVEKILWLVAVCSSCDSLLSAPLLLFGCIFLCELIFQGFNNIDGNLACVIFWYLHAEDPFVLTPY